MTPPRRSRLARTAGPLLVVAVALWIYGPVLRRAERWKTGDWGQHHALTKALARSMVTGHVPAWAITVSTGDSPYEMYPALTYFAGAGAAIALRAQAQVPAVLLGLAVGCHVFLSLTAARLTLRIGSWPMAATVGVLSLLDIGSFETGGAQSILVEGLIHSALAQCFMLNALVAALDGLERPRLRTSVATWALTALGTATHPSSLLFLAASLPALAVVAVTARDVRPRRALFAGLDLLLGTALGACLWLPFALRFLRYGIHLGFPSQPLWSFLESVVSAQLPPSSFPMVIGAGYVGVALGIFSRRAGPTLVAAVATALALGFTDAPYLLLGVADSPVFARFQPFRLLTLLKPLLFAAAGMLVSSAVRGFAVPIEAWRPSRGRRLLAGAFGVPLALVAVLAGGPWLEERKTALRQQLQSGVPDRDGFQALVEWARGQAASMRPGAFGRLMYAGTDNWIYHLAAESGLPTFFLGDAVALQLRERMEDRSPESLRRFDVRWVLTRGEPWSAGDPRTEQRFGSFFVREVPEWDGRFARVERGNGVAVVTRLEDERIDVELRETAQPALVALGTGYYPRWRARHERLGEIPVYAVPSRSGGSLRVISAWLPPGRTRFTPDGRLPSDGAGTLATVAALAFGGVAIAVVGSPRRRLAAVLGLARSRRWVRRHRRWVVVASVFAGSALLVFQAARGGRSPSAALELGPSWDRGAFVEARRTGGPWSECPYSLLLGSYRCGGLGSVGGGTGYVLTDHVPSNPYLTPAVVAWPAVEGVEFRLQLSRRFEGTYWSAMWGRDTATLETAGVPPFAFERKPVPLRFDPLPDPRNVRLVFECRQGRPIGVVLVRESALDVDRTRDVPWAPADPPSELSVRR